MLARTYTCDGANTSPPLHWSGVPAKTKELVLLVLGTQPVNGKLAYYWALAGINPKLNGLQAGQLPPGAVVGQSTTGHAGYWICPRGKRESYLFTLYALTKSTSPKPNFDPSIMRTEAQHLSRHLGILVGAYG